MVKSNVRYWTKLPAENCLQERQIMIRPGHREDRFAAHLIFIIDERLVLVGEEKLAHPVLKITEPRACVHATRRVLSQSSTTRDNSDELRITPIQQTSVFPRSHDRRTFMVRAAERLLGAGLFLSVVITLGGCGGTSATPAGVAALSSAPSGSASSNPGATGGTAASGSGPVTSTPPNPTAPQ